MPKIHKFIQQPYHYRIYTISFPILKFPNIVEPNCVKMRKIIDHPPINNSPQNQQRKRRRHYPLPISRPKILTKSPTFPFPTSSSSSCLTILSSSYSISSTFQHQNNCSALAELKRKQREESRKRATEAASSSLAKSKIKRSIANVKRPTTLLMRTMADPECTGFEAQNYLKERCKKCFRLREKHGLSPLKKGEEKEEILVLNQKLATQKRVQNIPTASLRRIPVKRCAKKEDEEEENAKKMNGKLEEKKEEKMIMKVIKVETMEEEKIEEKTKEKERVEKADGNSKATTRTTTTVLLPKQRQISIGSSGGPKKKASTVTVKEEEGKSRNDGWQFMGNKFDAGTKVPNVNGNGGMADVIMMESGAEEDLLSQSSYWTANSRGGANSSNSQGEMFSARSIDSLNSLSYAESFKTGKSPPFDEDDPFVTPTSPDANFFDEFDARALTPTAANQLEFSHLRVENQRLSEQCRRYRQERRRWTEWLKRQREKDGNNGNGKKMAEDALNELELMVSEYREENSALKCELDRAKDKEMSASVGTLMNGNAGMEAAQKQKELEAKLEAAECECEQLKREREELEQELEEMQDQYRVEEIEEFRELQRELELNAKNCRILQFKLRKSERQREQLQTEKNLLAKKYQQEIGEGKKLEEEAEEELEEESSKHSSLAEKEAMSRKVAELEQELRVAKEISVKLHTELEMAEERRYRMEDELFYNKEKVRELLAQNKWREAKNSREQQTRTREVLSGERPEHELHREVRDSLEREADLREQLRFTESDLQRTRSRLRELELENDELLQKYIKLADQQLQMGEGGGPMLTVPRKPNVLFRSISEGNDGKMAKEQQQQQEITLPLPTKLRKISESDETKAERKDSKETTADAEQLCYMLAAMDAQANRICKQLEKLDSTNTNTGNQEDKREKRRSLKGDIFPVLEELGGLLAEMKAIKEQLAKSQNISLTKSMILGNVLGDAKQREDVNEGEENNNSCSECEDSERKMEELKESCDFYKRKNAELTEQILQMKNQWAKESRKAEDEAEERAQKMAKELAELKVEMDEQKLLIRAGERALEESRAELLALNKRLAETTVEMEKAKEKVAAEGGGMDKGMEMAKKWEAKYKEMKGERIQLQAEVGQLKRRTEEAMQELDKMRGTHQQKEIGWIRERLKLEEQLKKNLANGEEEAEKDALRMRISELEKEKERLERELAEGKTAGKGKRADGKEQKQEEMPTSVGPKQVQKLVPIQQRKEAPSPSAGNGRPLLVVGGGKELQSTSSRVDYKQIADNALRAAESLQRQYREYQRQYTAEVQRLNTNLGMLERELADRERRLREQSQQQQQPAIIMAQKHQQPQIQMPPQILRRGAAESPSMSSLTENTTWDSRLLDCSMTRSISPFKFANTSRGGGGGNCPMMQCRTMEIHPPGHHHHPQDIGNFGSEEDVHREYRRTGSSGTNILYRIRREELSKGKNPSVRQMAKAFENFEKVHHQQDSGNNNKDGQKKKKKSIGSKSPLFGLLNKANSLEQNQSQLPPNKRKQSQGGGEGSPVPSEPHSIPTTTMGGMCSSATLPRGGRNPFKGMGSRIVERVRRSLSRSKKSQSRDGTPSLMQTSTMTPAPPEEPTPWK